MDVPLRLDLQQNLIYLHSHTTIIAIFNGLFAKYPCLGSRFPFTCIYLDSIQNNINLVYKCSLTKVVIVVWYGVRPSMYANQTYTLRKYKMKTEARTEIKSGRYEVRAHVNDMFVCTKTWGNLRPLFTLKCYR